MAAFLDLLCFFSTIYMVASQDSLVLYEHKNYELPVMLTLTADLAELGEGENDLTSSIEVFGVKCWEIFTEFNYGGDSMIVRPGEKYDIGDVDVGLGNDALSSARKIDCTLGQDSVLLFEHNDYDDAGAVAMIEVFDDTEELNALYDNKATSVNVNGVRCWQLFSEINYGGFSMIVLPGESYSIYAMQDGVGNDAVSSLKKVTCPWEECGDFPDLDHGYVSIEPPTTTYPDEGTYNCDPGYIMSGSPTVACQIHGSWEDLPTCNAVDCLTFPNDVDNGKISSLPSSTTFPEEGTYVCDDGYVMNGSPNVACQATGQWENRPTCDEIDECQSGPCQNGGSCVDAVNGYTCNCPPGYTDANCQTDIDECQSSPCENGGTCFNDVNGYTCNCPPGYTGEICQTDIDECQSSPCENDGSCDDDVNGYTCDCLPGYTGENCQTDIDECQSSPCENGGTCDDDVNGYTCNCLPGYTGENCQTDIDECQSSPCEYDGTCEDDVNGYTCNCLPGYTGEICQTDIDDCQSSPCENGGTCVDDANRYTCNCPPGYTDVNCQTGVDCGLFPVNIGNGGILSEPSATTFPESGTYQCDEGHNMTGSAVVTCQADGTWEDPPTCDAVDCGTFPTTIDNGGVLDLPLSTTFPETGTYMCFDGFTMTGSPDVACRSDGTWGNPPECNDIDECQTNPCENGGTCANDVNRYTCNCPPGYTGQECQTAVDCLEFPNDVDNGEILSPPSTTTYLATGTYKCNDGFIMTGPSEVACQANGQWEARPTCTAAYDCLDIQNAGFTSDGIYTISIDGDDVNVYCDLTTNGGGWTVIQKRLDGSENFYRDWLAYKGGFGDLNGEFWLGNDKISALSLSGSYELRVNLEDFEGGSKYAQYSTFRVYGEGANYLLEVSGYSGDAGDSMFRHSGSQFSTYDRDNDEKKSDICAEEWHSGWWFFKSGCLLNGCHLNGVYSFPSGPEGTWENIIWFDWKGPRYSLKKAEMMIRRL